MIDRRQINRISARIDTHSARSSNNARSGRWSLKNNRLQRMLRNPFNAKTPMSQSCSRRPSIACQPVTTPSTFNAKIAVHAAP